MTPNKYHPSGYAYGGALQPAKSVERMFYAGYPASTVWRFVNGTLMPFLQAPDFTLTPIDVIRPYCVGRNEHKRYVRLLLKERAERLQRYAARGMRRGRV